MGGIRHTYKNVVGIINGKRTLGRPRRRWKDITMNAKRQRMRVGLRAGFIWLRIRASVELL
jgi:hypothetical protein